MLTSPRSFPTLVGHIAVLAAVPWSFLHTCRDEKHRISASLHAFFVECILKIDPKTEVDVAHSSGSLLQTSLSYTAINQLEGQQRGTPLPCHSGNRAGSLYWGAVRCSNSDFFYYEFFE